MAAPMFTLMEVCCTFVALDEVPFLARSSNILGFVVLQQIGGGGVVQL